MTIIFNTLIILFVMIFFTSAGIFIGVSYLPGKEIRIDSIDKIKEICIARNKKFFMLSGSVNDTKYPYHCSNELTHGVEIKVK